MDPTLIANTVASWLVPLLPYLTTSTEEVAKTIGKEVGESAVGLAKKIYQLLIPSIEARPTAKGALEDVQLNATDDDAVASFRLQLKKILVENPQLAAQVGQLIGGAGTAGDQIAAFGERSVAAKSIIGSAVNTGDTHK